MIVHLEQQLFESLAGRDLQILALFELASHGRHIILTEPLWDPENTLDPMNAWLQEQSKPVRENVIQVLEAGIVRATSSVAPKLEIRITVAEKVDWEARPALLDLATAKMALARPLKLWVEDKVNDQELLLTVAPEGWRKPIREALDRKYIEIVHGGGLPRMGPQLEELPPDDRFLSFVVFDSDAKEPGVESAGSAKVRGICESKKLSYHQWQRRAAENYLPLPALFGWVDLVRGKPRTRRRQKVKKFAQMEPAQRHHYPMRDGFKKDQKSGIPAFFDNWHQEPLLQEGFDTSRKGAGSIRDLFAQDHVTIREEWLVRDGQQIETKHLAQKILERL